MSNGSDNKASVPFLRNGTRVPAILLILFVAGAAAYWQPPVLSPLWTNANIVGPCLSIVGLCLYVGCPQKHSNLPSLDSMVVVSTASFAVIEGLRHVTLLWNGPPADKAIVLGSIMLVAAGLKALQRGFIMADDQHKQPGGNADPTEGS